MVLIKLLNILVKTQRIQVSTITVIRARKTLLLLSDKYCKNIVLQLKINENKVNE